MALIALGLRGEPFHDPFHERPVAVAEPPQDQGRTVLCRSPGTNTRKCVLPPRSPEMIAPQFSQLSPGYEHADRHPSPSRPVAHAHAGLSRRHRAAHWPSRGALTDPPCSFPTTPDWARSGLVNGVG